jgi:hypothetical protein
MYTKDDLDYYSIWASDESAIYTTIHGDNYKVMLFNIVDGVLHPIQPIEFRDADWVLKLIHRCKLHPTHKNLHLI